jgi:hypothetical protein
MTMHTIAKAPTVVFQPGDPVVLSYGSHIGVTGTFVRLKDDVSWAEIMEENGVLRTHPLIWLSHRATT